VARIVSGAADGDSDGPAVSGRCLAVESAQATEKMVGAARFELATPSPPGGGEALIYQANFANDIGFGRRAINWFHNSCVGKRFGARQICFEDVRHVLSLRPNVRFQRSNRHVRAGRRCLRLTQSGHLQLKTNRSIYR